MEPTPLSCASGRIIIPGMPSFSDSIFLFILALLLFGPKKLPVLARELGKWVGEFRRASNEFKMQMEEELRASEQDERRKQIAAMEAAAPLPTPVDEPEHPHLRPLEAAASAEEGVPAKPTHEEPGDETSPASGLAVSTAPVELATSTSGPADNHSAYSDTTDSGSAGSDPASTSQESLPIATSGELRMMPPATGLPTPRSRSASPAGAGGNGALSTLVDSIPHQEPANGNGAVGNGALQDRESATHGH